MSEFTIAFAILMPAIAIVAWWAGRQLLRAIVAVATLRDSWRRD